MSDATDGQAQRQPTPSPAKQAIYHKHPQGKVSGRIRAGILTHRSELYPAPLSFAQQRLWFLNQLAPGASNEALWPGAWPPDMSMRTLLVGGDKLHHYPSAALATQLLSRIHDIFHIELPFHTFFQRPTVAGLAEAVVEQEAVDGQVIAIARLRKMIDSMSLDEMRTALQSKTTERRP